MDRTESIERDEELTEESNVAQLRSSLEEAQDLYLRTLADFDNYRKRIERERDEIGAAAKRDLLLGLVEIADNFERAMSASAGTEAQRGLAEGVAVIYRQIIRLLESHGVTAFESFGKKFDPDLHEAVGTVDAPDADEGTVVGELRRGYRWNGKLLVPAKVQVAR